MTRHTATDKINRVARAPARLPSRTHKINPGTHPVPSLL
jgi:hypothetical protein